MPHIIIGTAGHIDHGKSSLVKALTGTDPDRLIEEQERGMTIDLGFAFLTDDIAFIDVPGHERFIKNMVAGVSTVDMVLLVIAADDGVMPQTREHLDILSLLQIQRGIIVLTKVDLVEAEWLTMIKEDIQNLIQESFLQGAPILEVSSVTGQGLEHLKQAIVKMAAEITPRMDRGLFWMPVDRSFTVKGFGTVITGSVLSGSAQVNDALEILPAQKHLRVRGLQSHGKTVAHVGMGERAALNVTNVSKDEVQRGDIVATVDAFRPSSRFDATLRILKTARKAVGNGMRVRVHLGTREIMGRVKLLDCEKLEPGASALVQVLLEENSAAMRRDAFVIRQYSPSVTIGGGMILDTNPSPHRRFDAQVTTHLLKMMQQDPSEVVVTALLNQSSAAVTSQELARIANLPHNDVESILDGLAQQQSVLRIGKAAHPGYIHSINFKKLEQRAIHLLENFHEKFSLKPGINKAEFKTELGGISQQVFDYLLNVLLQEKLIVETGQWFRLTAHSIQLNAQDRLLAQRVMTALESSGYSTPSLQELSSTLGDDIADLQRIAGALQGMGDVVRLEGDIYFTKKQIEQARAVLIEFSEKNTEISVSQFRELLHTSRKYAMALSGHFDQIGLTERVGDGRVVKKPSV